MHAPSVVVLALLGAVATRLPSQQPTAPAFRMWPESVLDVAARTPVTLRNVPAIRVTVDPHGLPDVIRRLNLVPLQPTAELSLRRSGISVLRDTAVAGFAQ